MTSPTDKVDREKQAKELWLAVQKCDTKNILKVFKFGIFFPKRNPTIFMTDGRIETNVRAGE